MKYDQLDDATQELIDWEFGKFKERVFEYGELDYEAFIDYLRNAVEQLEKYFL